MKTLHTNQLNAHVRVHPFQSGATSALKPHQNNKLCLPQTGSKIFRMGYGLLLGLIILRILFDPQALLGQQQFQKFYGAASSEGFYSAVQSPDGGYAMLGSTYSFGNGAEDVILLKTDDKGSQQWLIAYGGTDVEMAQDIQNAPGGGYIVVGSSRSFNASTHEALAFRVSASGALLWSKTMSTAEHDNFRSVRVTFDGQYIVCGTMGNQACVLKMNDSGQIVWFKSTGESGSSTAAAVVQTADSGYAMAGVHNTGSGKMNVILVRLDKQGDTMWTRSYAAAGNTDVYGLVETAQGDLVISGNTAVSGSGEEMMLMKVSAVGNLIWATSYGGSGNDYGKNLVAVSGGYVLAGQSMSFGAGMWDNILLQTDVSGNVQWSRAYGTDKSDYANVLLKTADGGYALAGESYGGELGQTDGFVVKTDANGLSNCYDSAAFSGTARVLSQVAFKPYLTMTTTWKSVTALSVTDTFVARTHCPGAGFKDISRALTGIAPNPSEGPLAITLPESLNEITIVIRNVNGQTVYNASVRGAGNVRLYPQIIPGMYVVEVFEGNVLLSRNRWLRL